MPFQSMVKSTAQMCSKTALVRWSIKPQKAEHRENIELLLVFHWQIKESFELTFFGAVTHSNTTTRSAPFPAVKWLPLRLQPASNQCFCRPADWSKLIAPFPKKWAYLYCAACMHRLEVHLLDRTERCNFRPFIYLTPGFGLQIVRHKEKKKPINFQRAAFSNGASTFNRDWLEERRNSRCSHCS